MQTMMATDRVCLIEDLTELQLHRGDVGVIRSAWFYPNVAFEVEFPKALANQPCRILLLHEQIEPERDANGAAPRVVTDHIWRS